MTYIALIDYHCFIMVFSVLADHGLISVIIMVLIALFFDCWILLPCPDYHDLILIDYHSMLAIIIIVIDHYHR